MSAPSKNSIEPGERSLLRRVVSWLDEYVEFYINFFLYSLLTVVIVVEVFRRYMLDSATSYGEEVARYAFIWLAYFAAARGVKNRSHLSIDLLRDMCSRNVKFVLFLLSDLCFFVLSLIIIYTGSRFVITTIEFEQSFTGINLPLWLAVGAIPVGWSMIAIRVVQRTIKTIQAFRRGEPMVSGFIGAG